MSTAAAFNPALVPDREAGYRLAGVHEAVADGCRIELVLAFDGASLAFRPDPEFDTVEARFTDAAFRPTAEHRPLTGTAFDRFLGRELGWSWLAVNQQGYADTALLSFDGVIPGVMVHVIGSSVGAYAIGPAA